MRGWVLLAVGVALCSCGGGGGQRKPASTVKRAAAAAAQRSTLQLPTVAADGRCPVSRRHKVTRNLGAALGDGPVYPVGLARGSILRIAPAERFNSRQWGGDKVLWARRPGVRGTVVVRGLQLDGAAEVRFDSGDVPPDHLDLHERTPQGAWTGYPSYTRVREPGCYAYVVEGPGVREVIVFRAVR
jgi:hypothetical protein